MQQDQETFMNGLWKIRTDAEMKEGKYFRFPDFSHFHTNWNNILTTRGTGHVNLYTSKVRFDGTIINPYLYFSIYDGEINAWGSFLRRNRPK